MPLTLRSSLRAAVALALFSTLASCAGSMPEDELPVAAPTDAAALPPTNAAASPDAAPATAATTADGDQDAGGAATEQEIDTVIASVDDQIEEEDITPGSEPSDATAPVTAQEIPPETNADVERWIDYFTNTDRERFQRFLERGEKYHSAVTAVLRDQGVPPEIFYQAMIESGFACGATSRARAVGIWQFVKDTGRRYGLRVDSFVDERRDPLRATIAASLYLKDLYNVFQSWYLAMAAYNAGEGRIMNAIMRAKTRDFWEMAKNGALPSETSDYIPKFMAATIIGHDPHKYGFDDLHPETEPALVSVAVPSPIRLADVASVTGVPLEALKDYNPHLLRGMTPPGVKTYRLWVPKDQAADIERESDRLASLRVKGLRLAATSAAPDVPRFHTVARGETLAGIAALYGVSVRRLKQLNHLRSGRVAAGARLKLRARSRNEVGAAAPVKRYRVKNGDNLDSIARRFGLSIQDLKRLNRLKHNTVYVGQVLRLGNEEKG